MGTKQKSDWDKDSYTFLNVMLSNDLKYNEYNSIIITLVFKTKYH